MKLRRPYAWELYLAVGAFVTLLYWTVRRRSRAAAP